MSDKRNIERVSLDIDQAQCLIDNLTAALADVKAGKGMQMIRLEVPGMLDPDIIMTITDKE